MKQIKRIRLIFFIVYVMILVLISACSYNEGKNANEEKVQYSEISNTEINEEQQNLLTIDTICAKLKGLAQNLGDEVWYGTITLSQDEISVVKTFLRENIKEETESWAIASLQTILEDHEVNFENFISYIDYCSYNDCKLILTRQYELIYVDVETKKPIYIENVIEFES